MMARMMLNNRRYSYSCKSDSIIPDLILGDFVEMITAKSWKQLMQWALGLDNESNRLR
jgi:hypothetical protein